MMHILTLHRFEQMPLRICGKAYFWTRNEDGVLKLNPALVGDAMHPELLARLAEMN